MSELHALADAAERWREAVVPAASADLELDELACGFDASAVVA